MTAQERKRRSEAILASENVPFIEHLPIVQDETEVKLRSSKEIAERAVALCIVSLKGEGATQDEILSIMGELRGDPLLTPAEREFIFEETPSEHDRIQFLWRYESYWVMLWALGYIEELDRPDHICDVPKAVGILHELKTPNFIANARLRSLSEVLDQKDLIFRYHWAVVDARLNNREAPSGLDSSVVYERHYALNWLIDYMGEEWDGVSTHT